MPTASSYARTDMRDIVIAVAVAGLGAAALAMPHTLLQFGPPCLISLVLDAACWGCGMTRAALSFLHGDFVGAWNFNKLSLLVLPLLMALYLRHLVALYKSFTATI